MKRFKGFKRRTVKQIIAREVAMKLNPVEPNTGMTFTEIRDYISRHPEIAPLVNIGPPPK